MLPAEDKLTTLKGISKNILSGSGPKIPACTNIRTI